MDYQKMWKNLKEKINSDLEYHKLGEMQSMSESINGANKCQEILAYMTEIEEKEK